MNLRHLIPIFAAFAALAAQPAAAGPAFQEYPAPAFYQGPIADTDLSSGKARLFKESLTRQSAANFAGQYRVAAWSCSNGCLAWAIVDVPTGKVWFPPFTVEPGDCAGAASCQATIDYHADSELLILQGALDGQGAYKRHYFRWHDGALTRIERPRA